MPGAVFLRGDGVTLRTIEEADVEFLRDAINDPDVREGLTTADPVNLAQEREYFEREVSSGETVNLAVVPDGEAENAPERSSEQRSRDGEITGAVNLYDIDRQSGNCEVGVWLAPEFHGHGYAPEATRLVTDYAFRELRMHRVQARTLATNEAAARSLRKAGFVEDGVHRDEVFTGGEYVDVRYFSVLDEEWDG